MKKLFIGVLIIVCAICAVACVPKEPAEARVKLKREGYDVEIYQKDDEIEKALFFFDVDTSGVLSIVFGAAKDYGKRVHMTSFWLFIV